MASKTEAVAGNTTINPEAASTAVEMPIVVMTAAVDAVAAPYAGNSGSGGGVDVSRWWRRRRRRRRRRWQQRQLATTAMAIATVMMADVWVFCLN